MKYIIPLFLIFTNMSFGKPNHSLIFGSDKEVEEAVEVENTEGIQAVEVSQPSVTENNSDIVAARVQMYYVGAISGRWCAPCNTVTDIYFPQLRQPKWTYNGATYAYTVAPKKGQIIMLDIDSQKDMAFLSEQLGVPQNTVVTGVPTFLVINSEKKTYRKTSGLLTAEQIHKFYLGIK